METKITRASNGRGIAAQSTVEIIRAPGNMILDVTSTQNFPGVNGDNTVSGEIFHFGCWSADGGGVLVPGTLVEGKAHVSNIGEVTIDSLDPGFTDKGNNIGDIFMVKPTTGWANDMVEALQATLNPDGTLKNRSITADKVDFATFPKIQYGGGNLSGNTTTRTFTPGYSGLLVVKSHARRNQAGAADNVMDISISGATSVIAYPGIGYGTVDAFASAQALATVKARTPVTITMTATNPANSGYTFFVIPGTTELL